MYCVYIRVSLWSNLLKFIELVSLKVHMYTHAELRPVYQKPEPHQRMLIQLVQKHGNHVLTNWQGSGFE